MESKVNKDLHLDVFLEHSELHYNDQVAVFKEGKQTREAQTRYSSVTAELERGYLENKYKECKQCDKTILDETFKNHLRELVDGVTSEVGRALVGLTFLQITIKSIVPEQSIRLHKGSTRNGSFSWQEGMSMRTLDSHYTSPFLRANGLLNVNKDGVMMTRSLAENYPYSKLYKAEMRGPFDTWISIVDFLEEPRANTKEIAEASLSFLMSLLINKNNKFEELAVKAIAKLQSRDNFAFDQVENLLIDFFTKTQYSARALEVVMHGFMQAYAQNGLTDLDVVPMSQMRSANKKHGNVGDVELRDGPVIVESWDAKYGKEYLFDELDELKDKLTANPDVEIAGFVVSERLEIKKEIEIKVSDVAASTNTKVFLFTFKDWIDYKMSDRDKTDQLAKDWLYAVVESFARKRLSVAPIDEPCEGWLTDLTNLL